MKSLSAFSDVVATFANRDFVEIAIHALKDLGTVGVIPDPRHRLWVREHLVGPSEVFSCLDLIGCVTETWRQSYTYFPWIQTSRGPSCSTTA